MAMEDIPRGLTGIILAGGQGSRMDGWDKGLLEVCDRTLVERVIEALRPQVDDLVIVANRHQGAYRRFRYPVVAAPDGAEGLLASLEAGMTCAQTDYVLCVPCDAALLPPNLAARLWRGLGRAEAAVAHDGERPLPRCALLSRRLLWSLRAFLAAGGSEPRRWLAQHRVRAVDFSDWPSECWSIGGWQDWENTQRALAALGAARPQNFSRTSATKGRWSENSTRS